MGFKRSRLLFGLLLCIMTPALLSVSCSDSGDDDKDTESRSYYLGCTPFPHDTSVEAVEYAYGKLDTDADMTAHHFDGGVPWPEALAETDYHPYLMSNWQYRKDNTPDGHRIYVAVTPISWSRDDLAPYWGEEESMPLPSPWDTYHFDNENVKSAYLNYCKKVIEYFSPDYFCMGIEVNLLMQNAQLKWEAYVDLHRYVYGELKSLYPDRVIMVSFTGMDLLGGYTEADHEDQTNAFNDIINYTDFYGLSMHMFMSSLTCDFLPDAVFEGIFSLSGKPVCICETTYPAEELSLYGGSLVFSGSPEKQDAFYKKMFAFCDAYSARFIISFIIRDYDDLWEYFGSPDDITKVWRDTGLYDENGTARIAHERWMDRLSLPVR